ncbi:MAG: hypothetical protein IPO21_18145 [Bacteroidales bacterium]|nr:hypothetical protein [Bacteroidales bacterium]
MSLADTVLFQKFSSKKTNRYTIEGKFSKVNLKFLNIYYGNDLYFNDQDRNLFIDSLKIGSFVLCKKSILSLFPDHALDQCRRNYPFRSNGAYLQAYLKSLGYLNKGTVVDTMYCGRNQTLYMAKHITQHVVKEDTKYNILSYFLHSRRTKITYSRFISTDNLGIYALGDISKPFETWHKTKETIRFVIDEWFSIFIGFFYMA